MTQSGPTYLTGGDVVTLLQRCTNIVMTTPMGNHWLWSVLRIVSTFLRVSMTFCFRPSLERMPYSILSGQTKKEWVDR